ncbi:hypothetical protein V3C99_018336 [Haemonchus contortus]
MNVTSIEGPSPKPTYFSNDNPEQCNTEAILPVDEEVEAMDIGMDVSTSPLDEVNVEIKEKQAIKSFDLLVTSTEEPAPKYFKPRYDKSSSSETDNSSDYDPRHFWMNRLMLQTMTKIHPQVSPLPKRKLRNRPI